MRFFSSGVPGEQIFKLCLKISNVITDYNGLFYNQWYYLKYCSENVCYGYIFNVDKIGKVEKKKSHNYQMLTSYVNVHTQCSKILTNTYFYEMLRIVCSGSLYSHFLTHSKDLPEYLF